jgi:sortase A
LQISLLEARLHRDAVAGAARSGGDESDVIVHRRRGSRPAREPAKGVGHGAARPRYRALLRGLEGGLWSLALGIGAWLGYVALDRAIHDRQQARTLPEPARAVSASTSIPAVAALPTAAIRPPLASGEPIGRLEIPDVGISALVAAGTGARTLRRGVGHIDGTSLPGEAGNIGLAGHRDTVFRELRKLRPADRIFLVTAEAKREYVVESLRTVAPERSDVLDASAHPTLTLVTCYPFDFIGPAPLRFIVRAREVGRGRAAPLNANAMSSEGPNRARRP